MTVRCASCGGTVKWPRGKPGPLRLLAVFKRPEDSTKILELYDVACLKRRCRHCGWINVFEEQEMDAVVSAP